MDCGGKAKRDAAFPRHQEAHWKSHLYVSKAASRFACRRTPNFLPSSLLWLALIIGSLTDAAGLEKVGASSSQAGFAAAGAIDQDRFSFASNHAWKGEAVRSNWFWEIQFSGPRDVGAILQIQGDHEFVFQNSPKDYLWQSSLDGFSWHDLRETRVQKERRLFRLHRLAVPEHARFLRLQIARAEGNFPTIREVEFYENPNTNISFPDWIIAVNTTHDPRLPGHGHEFIPLAKSCAGWETLQAQQVWLSSFDESFCQAEPKPLCAFLSGNFKDFCQVEREPWRGTEEILKHGHLPIWASCGGAQALAILATVGVEQPWDCPHCRDPQHPRNPIYTHIGHTDKKPCGDYSGCIFERGPHAVLQTNYDPVFQGLADEFSVMESHCGQIEWPPEGWEMIAGAGRGTKTKTQCLKVKDHCIYAAQFHIEMNGTPEISRHITSNFLRLARRWGGYNPER